MFERHNDKHGTGRLRTALAIAAATAVVASMAIVGTVAAQPGRRFFDVPRTHYAYQSIEWAVTNGITEGCGDGRNFCPDDTLNRAQMVTFLKRYHDNLHVDTSDDSDDSDDSSDPEEYTVGDYGSTDESINLPAGRYRVRFTLEHDGNLGEFDQITLTVEDSGGREVALCVQDTMTGYDDEDTYICRDDIEVGTRLGQFDPGRIYFTVAITDDPDDQTNRVHFAEWEILITER